MNGSRLVLRALAALIALRAVTNLVKPLGFNPFGARTGLVFFGTLLSGTPNLVLSPLMGLYMLAYACGMWQERRFALPMGIAYAIFVPVNMALFLAVEGLPSNITPAAYAGFVTIGTGLTTLAVVLLWRRRDHLR
jgi:hypothetical protein